MAYEMKQSIIKECQRVFLERPNNWAVLEYTFGYEYNRHYKQYFGRALTDVRVENLLFAGKNLAYALKTYQDIEGCSVDKLLLFIEKFVNLQLED